MTDGTLFTGDQGLDVGSYEGYEAADLLISGSETTATFAGALSLWEGCVTVAGGAQLRTASHTVDLTLFDEGIQVFHNEVGAGSTVCVRDAGSHWQADGELEIYGELDIDQGGVTVSQKLTNQGKIAVGNGGELATGYLENHTDGTIALNVSGNDMLVVGDDFTNEGAVRLMAGANLAAGTYTPISVGGDWLGSGSYEACGGLWDESFHTFIVTVAQSGVSGEGTIVDLSDAPRLDITDGTTGQQVGASFSEGAGTIDFTATATAMTNPTGLTDLSIKLSSGETVLSGWDFDTDLEDDEEVLLSFYIGDGFDIDNLKIWHYDASIWTAYDANGLTYVDGWASFVVNGFSGYAMTANVPEPATLAGLLGLCLAGFLALSRRKR